MPDESFLEDLFGSPPRPQPVPSVPSPAPAVPAAFASPRPVRSPSRRYGLLVTLLVGLTAVPSWIVLRAGLEGVDPDFGARLAGPVQPFVVPGDHLAQAPLRLPERPVRPAPQADPGLAQAALHDDAEPDDPPGDTADPLLEKGAPAPPPARPIWRPAARPPKPGAVRPVPPPAPAPDPGPAFPDPTYPGPGFPGPAFPGGEPSFPGPSSPGGPGLPGGGPFPSGPLPGVPAFPGGPWGPGGHGRQDRPHLPWHWHRHDHGGWAGHGEPCEPGGSGDRSGGGRTVVADGPRQPVPARRAVPRDLRRSAGSDQVRPVASRLRAPKVRPGATASAAKRKWHASREGNFWVAKATHGLPSAARVIPPQPVRIAPSPVTALAAARSKLGKPKPAGESKVGKFRAAGESKVGKPKVGKSKVAGKSKVTGKSKAGWSTVGRS